MHSARFLAAALVAAIPTVALAHGGSYSPPPPGPGGPGGPQVPPGTADPTVPATRWETWWAANKEFFLHLSEEMKADEAPTSGGMERRAARASPAQLRAERDAGVRDALTPIFLEALSDDSFEVRTAAAIALGKTGSPAGSKPLRKSAFEDRHKDVRDAAVLGLGLLGQPADIPFLDGVLNDRKQNARFRSFAAFSLGLIGGEDAATALLTFERGRPNEPASFEHEPAELIACCLVAMGLSGDPHVLPVLREAVHAQRYDPNVQAFALLSLGRMRDRDSLADTGRILAVDKEPNLRRSAAIALGRIATRADVASVEALHAAVERDTDQVVRQFAAISLGGLGGPQIAARLKRLFPDATSYTRPFLALSLALSGEKDVCPMLRDALESETDESVKASYCVSLALLGDQASAPLMEKQLSDHGRVWLQGYAAVSLGMLHHVDSVEMLNQRLVSETDPRLRANLAVALGLLHDPRAKAHLVATLKKDGTVYERGGAAMAIGVLRMDSAFIDVADVYRNKKEQDMVRAFAVVSLGILADPSAIPKLARFAIDNNYTLATDPLNEVLSIL